MVDPGRAAASATSGRRLSQEQILVAAVAMLDAEGANGLTMRKLGKSLGVEAMSLYRHFPSRGALLDAIADHMVGAVETDPALQWAVDDDWRDYIDRLAHGVRQLALTHPRVFPLICSRPGSAPWIRPPMRSLQWVDTFLAGLQDHSFPPPAAVTVYKRFTAFLLGHLLLEIAGLGLDHPDRLNAPPPPGDQDQSTAAKRRSERAKSAEKVLVGPGTPSAQEIVQNSVGREDGLADEPAVVAAAPDIAAAAEGSADIDAVRADLDIPIAAAVADSSPVSMADYPHVAAFAGLLAEDTAGADFEHILGFLLDDLDSLRQL